MAGWRQKQEFHKKKMTEYKSTLLLSIAVVTFVQSYADLQGALQSYNL